MTHHSSFGQAEQMTSRQLSIQMNTRARNALPSFLSIVLHPSLLSLNNRRLQLKSSSAGRCSRLLGDQRSGCLLVWASKSKHPQRRKRSKHSRGPQDGRGSQLDECLAAANTQNTRELNLSGYSLARFPPGSPHTSNLCRPQRRPLHPGKPTDQLAQPLPLPPPAPQNGLFAPCLARQRETPVPELINTEPLWPATVSCRQEV